MRSCSHSFCPDHILLLSEARTNTTCTLTECVHGTHTHTTEHAQAQTHWHTPAMTNTHTQAHAQAHALSVRRTHTHAHAAATHSLPAALAATQLSH